jgi:hypothetical protein
MLKELIALETLINSLRTQLTRLTRELSTHRELLTELKTLRDIDSATLREKSAEITSLKNEVERLAGEVEVLRDVVEEGLRERRAAREASSQQDSIERDVLPIHGAIADHFTQEFDEEEDEEYLGFEAEDASRNKAVDKTIRTDRATEGSRGARFIDSAEFERISAEIDERRSDRSISAELSQYSYSNPPVHLPPPRATCNREADTHDAFARRPYSPEPPSDPEDEVDAGPSAPHFAGAQTRRRRAEPEASFPTIRGKRLERMFFAAPEHDPRTCTTCNQRRRRSDEHPVSLAWRNRRAQATRQARSRRASNEQEDEGFAEPDEYEQPLERGQRRERSLQDINEVRSIARQEGLPPQTIVARIIRELEDDFTHYKR